MSTWQTLPAAVRKTSADLLADSYLPSRSSTLDSRRNPVSHQRNELDRLREQLGQMEMRAVAAEAEVTSLTFEKVTTELKVQKHKDLALELSEQLNSEKDMNRKYQEVVLEKINTIREGLTKQIEELRKSEKDARICLEAVQESVKQYKSGLISKKDFFSQVDTIFECDKNKKVHPKNKLKPAQSFDEKLQESHPLRLISLTNGVESEKKEANSLGEDIIFSPSPPPVPPRPIGKPSAPNSKVIVEKEELKRRLSCRVNSLYSLAPPPGSPGKFSEGGFVFGHNMRWSSDSELSDYDKPLSPRAPSHMESQLTESVTKLLKHPVCQLPDSKEPICDDFEGSIKKSSPIMVKRPKWFRKGASVGTFRATGGENKLSKKRLSRSLDSSLHKSVEQTRAQPVALSDSEDTAGGSTGYTKPFHHIKLRKRFISSRNTMSPHKLFMNSIDWHRYDSDGEEDGFYINPHDVPKKKPQSKKPVQLNCSDTYLTLEQFAPAQSRKIGVVMEHPKISIQIQPGPKPNPKTKKPIRGSLSDGTSDSEIEDSFSPLKQLNIYEDPDSNRASPLFDNQAYEPSRPPVEGEGLYAKIEEFRKDHSPQPQTDERKSASPKPPKLSRMDSDWLSEDGYARVAEFIDSAPAQGPPSLPPRPPTFARVRPGNPARTVPGIGSLPRYTTLGGSEHEVRLVPLEQPKSWDLPSDLAPVSSSVPTSFHSPVMPRKSLQHSRATPNLHGDDQSEASNLSAPRSVTPTALKKISIVQSKRSSTLPGSVVHKSSVNSPVGVIEKRGYLQIQDGKQRPKKRWIVLKGSELKSYSKRRENQRRARDVINLNKGCKLSTGDNGKEFQLDVSSGKVYKLSAQSKEECEDWVNVIEIAMQCVSGGSESTDDEPTAVTSLSGWARVDGASTSMWCWSEGSTLFISQEPGAQHSRELNMEEHAVKLKKESILLDSASRVLHITNKETRKVTIIQPNKEKVIEEWCYILNSLNSQESGPQLTRTEQFLSEIMKDDQANQFEHFRWQNPLFKVTAMPLQDSLISMPSQELKDHAKEIFKDLQQFMNKHIDVANMDFHIGLAQNIIGQCLSYTHLQNEVYCQLLRQMSGHTNPISPPVLQGWLLLFILLPMYLPSRKLIEWYLSIFLRKSAISKSPVICDFAKNCLSRLCVSSSRQCTPTFFELKPLFDEFIVTPLSPPTGAIATSVYLSDDSVHTVVFDATTTVSDLTADLSTQAGLPDSDRTGFALMCDWPGVSEETMCCPFPESKVCDVVSMWTLSMEELNQTAVSSSSDQRNITFTYKRRLAFRKQRGSESSNESILLAHQINRDLTSGLMEIPRQQLILLSAVMAQLEYGDWTALDQEEQRKLAADAVVRFCPWKMTHMVLEHDRLKLEKELTDAWRELSGKSKEECARLYLTKAQEWPLCGATLFSAELQASPLVQVWLAINEDGISILKFKNMELIKFYSYSEISTFGGHDDNEFMLVASPECGQGNTMTTRGEKVLFTMDKIQICEATFLMASYIECLKNNS